MGVYAGVECNGLAKLDGDGYKYVLHMNMDMVWIWMM